MKIALIQQHATPDREANMSRLAEQYERLVSAGARAAAAVTSG